MAYGKKKQKNKTKQTNKQTKTKKQNKTPSCDPLTILNHEISCIHMIKHQKDMYSVYQNLHVIFSVPIMLLTVIT